MEAWSFKALPPVVRNTSKETSPTQQDQNHEEGRPKGLWEREEATGQSRRLSANFQEKGPLSCELKKLEATVREDSPGRVGSL